MLSVSRDRVLALSDRSARMGVSVPFIEGLRGQRQLAARRGFRVVKCPPPVACVLADQQPARSRYFDKIVVQPSSIRSR